MTEFSIIVPTYKECNNLSILIPKVFDALSTRNAEMIIVDDNSQDGSFELVHQLKKKYNVKIIVRTKERGLSSAVMKGFAEASGRYLLCMDADLQHPPESVPVLLDALRKNEFVVGTRYAKGVSIDKDWPLYRRVMSEGARMLARPLTGLSDPMSGFFGLQQAAYERALKQVNPIGFKIGLELYVKAGVKQHAEVPIVFGLRQHGESKLSSKVIIGYLLHLADLYWYRYSLVIVLAMMAAVLALYFLLNKLF